MAAPSGTIWGSTVGGYGRIGLYIEATTINATTYAGKVHIWFWSKYSVSDSNNKLYFNLLAEAGSATTDQGSVSINTTVASGDGWSTSNQKEIASYSFSCTKSTSSPKRYFYAKLADVDRVGGAMYASTTFNIPTLASYTVKYNANGGSNAPSSQTKWYGQSLTLSTTKPTRSGYTFQGWSTANDSSVEYASGASYTGNAALTLYAVWKANTYTVKYNANGGTGAPSNQTKTHGTALTLSTTKPTRSGYNFKGWALSASSTTASYASGASYTANAAVTLYAVWELGYVEPKITSLSAHRINELENPDDRGTYAMVIFGWKCDQALKSIVISWVSADGDSGEYSVPNASSITGTSRSVKIGGSLSKDKAYLITVTVEDNGGSVYRSVMLNSEVYPIDFKAGGNGVAIGKTAELPNTFDIAWLTKLRDHLCIGEKEGHLDGLQGVFASKEGYIHLQRSSAQGYHPYIAFLHDNETSVNAQIRYNSASKILEFKGAESYSVDDVINAKEVVSNHSDLAFVHQHPTSGTIASFGVGSGGANHGIWNELLKRWLFKCDGTDIFLASAKGEYKPYYSAGDTFDIMLRTSGYCTNAMAEVHFIVPLAKPMLGSPTVSATSVNGLILRCDDKYTHGSSASSYVKPASFACSRSTDNHIAVVATLSSTTNAINNTALGIYANIRITFS